MAGFSGVVYAHTGVITNNSTSNTDWKYTKGTWGTANAPILTSIGNDKYTLTISDIRAYYGVPSGESIEKIKLATYLDAMPMVQIFLFSCIQEGCTQLLLRLVKIKYTV